MTAVAVRALPEDSTAGHETGWHARARMSELLTLAGRGHWLAFMRFYDETAPVAYGMELRRWEDPELAELATHARYVAAWARAAEHAGSGLSPLAWLLSLELGRSDG